MTQTTKQIRIGIIYIAIGVYDELWQEFYPTCECFFCPDAQKGYEVFTDSSKLQSMNIKSVAWHTIQDRGFIWNVSAKSEFICSIASKLKEKYDYIFYMNGNYKFIEPIQQNEVLPSAENNFLTALSFDLYKNTPIEQLTYDRNPNCHAYMEAGAGTKYYQGGFYGGRTEEIIKLSQWCMKYIQEDLNNKIIALWHDESYLNKYLSNYTPRVLNEMYGYAEFTKYYQKYKAILLDKNSYLGSKLDNFKQLSIDNSLSFLLDDNLQPKKIGIVNFAGGLGNQMFQYAFYLYLKNTLGRQVDFYIKPNDTHQLIDTFEITESEILPEQLEKLIAQANPKQMQYVAEASISCIQEFNIPPTAITIYNGYWQCADYVETNLVEIRNIFKHWRQTLNTKNQVLLNQIQSTCSVSIHIRRGDYMTPFNKEIYGGICTKNYYAKAIKKMKQLLAEEPIFYVFTDDPEWTKKHFKYKNCILIEGNYGENDWQDLALMSACRHHIIANSSFSWWGALLEENPKKQVIAPNWWYKGMPTPDLLPLPWVQIPVEMPEAKEWLSAYLNLNGIAPYNNMPFFKEMTLSIYYFNLARIAHKSIYKAIAEKKLDYICSNIGKILSISEFVRVSHSIIYLYSKKYITGNSSAIFYEIDAYIQNWINSSNHIPIINELTAISGYLVSRITVCNKSAKQDKLRLGGLLEKTMQLIWEHKNILSSRDKEYLLIISQKMIEMNLLHTNNIPLLMFCINDYDVTHCFLSNTSYPFFLFTSERCNHP